MEKSRYLACLDADYQRLRTVAIEAPDAAVPSCPEWTMADLVRHVAGVYLHKVEGMRRGAEQPSAPDLAGEEPIAALENAYRELVAEFAARPSTETTPTWYTPDQTVGFWVRRMAQETVIHRVDGELAAGATLAPVPDDLAFDGIDEVLVRFLSYCSYEYPQELGDQLAECDGRAVRLAAGDASWFVRLAPKGIAISTKSEPTAATVGGTPVEVLLWLWRRVDEEVMRVDGDAELVARLRELMRGATQ